MNIPRWEHAPVNVQNCDTPAPPFYNPRVNYEQKNEHTYMLVLLFVNMSRYANIKMYIQ